MDTVSVNNTYIYIITIAPVADKVLYVPHNVAHTVLCLLEDNNYRMIIVTF